MDEGVFQLNRVFEGPLGQPGLYNVKECCHSGALVCVKILRVGSKLCCDLVAIVREIMWACV